MEEKAPSPKDQAVDSLRMHTGKLIGICVIFVSVGTIGASVYELPGMIPVNREAGEIIRKFAWTLYLAAWIAGGLWDASVQRDAYRHVPTGRVPWAGMAAIVMITCLLYASYATHYWIMATVLILLWLIDISAWQYFVRQIVRPSVEMSRKTYGKEHRFFELEKLDIVSHRIAGRWKWYRFLVGMLILLVLLYVAFRGVPWQILQRISPYVKSVPEEYILAVIFLVFVLVVEGWILFIRVRAEFGVSILEKLAESYRLTPVVDGEES